MMMRRRRLLATGLAAALAPRLTWAEVGQPTHLACAKDSAGAYCLAGLRADGAAAFRLPLPDRGHAGATHPVRAEAVVFARRPGTYALVLDAATGVEIARLSPPVGQQFNGHGAFLSDGALLCTSEVVAEGSAGRIGLWAADEGYRRIGTWDTGGIGPHEILAIGQDRLVVANGGIETDPHDRTKLNIDRMRPSLVQLSARGEVTDMGELPPDLHRASIRHLAPVAGQIAFGIQWEGDPAEAVPTLGFWTPGAAPALVAPPDAALYATAGYAGSVAAWGDRVAVTAPRGGCLQIFDASGGWLATHTRADICGVAAAAGGFVASDGNGALWTADDTGLRRLAGAVGDLAWDNHLVAL